MKNGVLIVKQGDNWWRAYLTNPGSHEPSGAYGEGKTPSAALGSLVRDHAAAFGVVLSFGKDDATQQYLAEEYAAKINGLRM